MKACPDCGTVNSDDATFCNNCAGSLDQVPSVSMDEALLEKNKVDSLRGNKPVLIASRAPGIVALAFGLLLLIGGVGLLVFLGNIWGFLLLIGGFFVVDSVTGLSQGTLHPSRSWRVNRELEREKDRERDSETVDN